MKNGKKPTLNDKKHIASCRLQPANWLISKKMMGEWLIIHRVSGKTRIIPAP